MAESRAGEELREAVPDRSGGMESGRIASRAKVIASVGGIEIPLARIGPIQMRDVERSGLEIHNDYARTCTVLKGDPPSSSIGDATPWILEQSYGHSWKHWNRQFVIQVAGCPLSCSYCYIDNLTGGRPVTIAEMISWYGKFWKRIPILNTFHFMGGCPGAFAHYWPVIRQELDEAGFRDSVLLTDVILIEEWAHGVRPWIHIPDRTLVNVCIKGTSFSNFETNTGRNLFPIAMKELDHYLGLSGVHFTVIEPDPRDVERVRQWVRPHRLDVLTVKEYEVVKWRKRESLLKKPARS